MKRNKSDIMRSEYEYVKYYHPSDWAFSMEVEKAVKVLEKYDSTKKYDDINEVIELYNIQRILEESVSEQILGKIEYVKCSDISNGFMSIVARYFASIDNSNFIDICESLLIVYTDDYWKLFEKFKTYKNVSAEVFGKYINFPKTTLYSILEHKEIVKYYGASIAACMRISDQAPQIIIYKYMEKNKSKYFIPKELNSTEYEGILDVYIKLESVNVNDLQLIMNYQSTKECPISDKLKVKAKQALEQFWKKPGIVSHKIRQGFGIKYREQDEVKKSTFDGENLILTYDLIWLEDNLDYATILNNFIYVFDMFDLNMRSNLVSVKSKISALESAFLGEGDKYFRKGNWFDINAELSHMQMTIYYEFLKKHEIELEDIFKWFFEEYLEKEFGIKGFLMTSSSPSASMVERCRNIASEMDGVLKQFRMYVRDGIIDREEYEMSSEHLVIDGFTSLIRNKYAYANSDEINQEMFLLFSDQSMLGYTKKEETRHSTFIEVLEKEITTANDYEQYQISNIEWLIERKCIEKSEEGVYKTNKLRCVILKELYNHDVICLYKINDESGVLQNMIDAGDLRIGNTLFSEPEKDFINYELNKAEFSNGLDLRNKYAHATYPKNEIEQRRDYMELLKVMDIVITKINDELCTKYQ